MSINPILLLMVELVAFGPSQQSHEVPTWAEVAPLLEQHCTRCHHLGGVAPMSLETYTSARPWAKSIARAVRERTMPPWFADPRVGEFSNDPTLDERTIERIVRWVAAGARAGAASDSPEQPGETERRWRIGEPDLIVEMPKPFAVPASGVVDYVNVRIPLDLETDRWIEAIEALPSEPSVVHHIDVFTCVGPCREGMEPGEPTFFPLRERPPGWTPTWQQDDRADVFALDEQLLFSYLPGGDPWILAPGQARLLPRGSELLLNVHYTPNGEARDDRSQVAIRFADQPPQTRVLTFGVDNESLRIPAGSRSHVVRAAFTISEPATLLALTPHMHFRGTRFDIDLIEPGSEGNERKSLLSLPSYDFNWQLTYRFEKPLRLEPGTRIVLEGTYDNSGANPFNPDPSREVLWGRQTVDEMMSAWIEVAVPHDLDPEMLVAPSSD